MSVLVQLKADFLAQEAEEKVKAEVGRFLLLMPGGLSIDTRTHEEWV